MNFLEKVSNVLTKDARQIKYGTMTTETADTLITLEVGDSLPNVSHLGDQIAVEYQILIINVFSVDYIAGYNLLETLKSELKATLKDMTKLLHTGNIASEYDKEKARYIFKANFKIII